MRHFVFLSGVFGAQMPMQGKKKCSLCGGTHNIRTCGLPGAQRARAAFLLLKAGREKGRKWRGTGPAAQSRKPALHVWKKIHKKKNRQDLAAERRKLYSGDQKVHTARWERRKKAVSNLVDDLDPDTSVEKLIAMKFLRKPRVCPCCKTGGLHGPAKRPGVSSLQRFWRCDNGSCRSWCNCLQGCQWLSSTQRFRALTPARVLHVVTAYCSSQCPRPQTIAATMSDDALKATQVIMDALRAVEANAAILEQRHMTLTGDVEMDATAVRTFRIGPTSHAFKEEVDAWFASRLHFVFSF